jgi:hypothetical protein
MNYGLKATGIVLAIVLTACGSDSAKVKEIPVIGTAEEAVNYSDRLTEYKEFVSALDVSKVESSTEAVKKYSELLKGADPEICDKALVVFHELYERIEENVANQILHNNSIQDSPCVEMDENGKELPMSKLLSDLDKKWKKHGFRLECWEGFPGVGTNRDFIAENFYKSVSPTMRKFLKALQENDDNVFQVDAGIVLTEKQFVDRAVWWENFVVENPDFVMIERAKALKKEYFTYLIYGMNNTPAISYLSTGGEESISDLDEYFVAAYTYLNKKYPASEANKLVKPFFKAAMARDFQKVEQIRNDYTKKGFMIDFEKDQKLYL